MHFFCALRPLCDMLRHLVPHRLSLAVAFVFVAGCAAEEPLRMPRLAPREASIRPKASSPHQGASPRAGGLACSDTADGFEPWLAAFEAQAAAGGISRRTLTLALGDLSYAPEVIAQDRGQRAFSHTFEELVQKRVPPARVTRGRAMMHTHAGLLARIEATFGVAPSLLVALWGLETDFGQNVGTYPTFRALATLAYDCRRAERFRGELLAALRIVDRGDMNADDMVGAWAGEIGQTQFLPTSYEAHAVDFDGDGKADLVRSSADALASTASYLRGHGYAAGKPYHRGTPNYDVLGSWNASDMYRRVIVHYAERLEDRPAKR